MDFRRAVVAGGRKRDASGVRGARQHGQGNARCTCVHHCVLEANRRRGATVFLGGKGREPVANYACRGLRRLAVEVAARRGRCCRRIGNLGSIGGAHADVTERHTHLVRDDLRDLRVQPLPHLGPAVAYEHGAVHVEVHQRAGLVVVRRIEGDAELHGRDRDAAANDGALGIEPLDGNAPRAILARLLEVVHQRFDDVVLEHSAVRRLVAIGDAVEIARAAHPADRAPGAARCRRGSPRWPSSPGARRSHGTPCWRLCASCTGARRDRGFR